MTTVASGYDYPPELVEEAARLFGEGDGIVLALARGDQKGVYLLRQQLTSVKHHIILDLLDDGKGDELYAIACRMDRIEKLRENLTRFHEEARPLRN